MAHEVHKADLVLEASRSAGVTKEEAEKVVGAFLNALMESVAAHGDVQIRKFGTLRSMVKPPREISITDPKTHVATGRKVMSKPNVFIRFTPATDFKELVLEKQKPENAPAI